jgi:hypothetical protein
MRKTKLEVTQEIDGLQHEPNRSRDTPQEKSPA